VRSQRAEADVDLQGNWKISAPKCSLTYVRRGSAPQRVQIFRLSKYRGIGTLADIMIPHTTTELHPKMVYSGLTSACWRLAQRRCSDREMRKIPCRTVAQQFL
jgi:hypothetical protein